MTTALNGSLTSRVAIVTGGSRGVGGETGQHGEAEKHRLHRRSRTTATTIGRRDETQDKAQGELNCGTLARSGWSTGTKRLEQSLLFLRNSGPILSEQFGALSPSSPLNPAPGCQEGCHSSCPSIFAFLELELPDPQPQQREADPQGINPPISRGFVCTFQPETCDAREDEADADHLIDFHAFSIADISFSARCTHLICRVFHRRSEVGQLKISALGPLIYRRRPRTP